LIKDKPRSRAKMWLVTALAVLVVLSLILGSCSIGKKTKSPSTATATTASYPKLKVMEQTVYTQVQDLSTRVAAIQDTEISRVAEYKELQSELAMIKDLLMSIEVKLLMMGSPGSGIGSPGSSPNDVTKGGTTK
jgi:hypothetical protein